MKASHVLKASVRPKIGSRYAQRERAKGLLPAVVYGHGETPVAVTLDKVSTVRYLKEGEKVFTLSLEGKGEQTVIVRDLQFDYLGTNVVHVDLARVDLNEVIVSSVPTRLVGEAVGMKKAGNLLTHPTTTIDIRCTVANLPDHIDVNITNLDVGQSIHAREVPLPAGAELVSDPDAIIAVIKEIKVVEEAATGEAAGVSAEAAQPEVITAKKEKAEEGAAGKDDKKAAAPKEKGKG